MTSVTNSMFDKAVEIIDFFTKQFGLERKGGHLALFDREGVLIRQQRLGSIDSAERAIRTASFAREKAGRLLSYPEHLTSWESHDEEKEQYGGAIKVADGTVLSFSGFPQEHDTLFCMVLAGHSGLASRQELQLIAQRAEITALWEQA